MSTRPTTVVLVSLLLAASRLEADPAPTPIADELTPVLATVVATPAVVIQSDGLWKLAYELELTNVTDAPMTIESVEVLAPERGGAAIETLRRGGGLADQPSQLLVSGRNPPIPLESPCLFARSHPSCELNLCPLASLTSWMTSISLTIAMARTRSARFSISSRR